MSLSLQAQLNDLIEKGTVKEFSLKEVSSGKYQFKIVKRAGDLTLSATCELILNEAFVVAVFVYKNNKLIYKMRFFIDRRGNVMAEKTKSARATFWRSGDYFKLQPKLIDILRKIDEAVKKNDVQKLNRAVRMFCEFTEAVVDKFVKEGD